MITGVFRIGGDVNRVIIDRDNLMFMDSNGTITTIDGLRINKAGVLKEFPDLENNDDWKKTAINRLKEKIKQFNSEGEQIDYVKDELTKFGYLALYKQKAGHRPKKW